MFTLSFWYREKKSCPKNGRICHNINQPFPLEQKGKFSHGVNTVAYILMVILFIREIKKVIPIMYI
jgi:hypothetical protein